MVSLQSSPPLVQYISLRCFYALLEGFCWDGPHLRRYSPFDDDQALKKGPLMLLLSFGKIHTDPHRVNRDVLLTRMLSTLNPFSFLFCLILQDNFPNTVLFHAYLDIGMMVRVFANGPGDLGSIPDRVILKTQTMVPDVSFLNTQHYKLRI